MTLGEKLRCIRRERHLTQEAVAGDFITRNMLSRIETDDASPSLETLRYLADRLGVPVGYLLSGEDLSVCRRPEILLRVQTCYKAGEYAEAEKLCTENGLSTDETELILCDIFRKKGKEALSHGDFSAAVEHFSHAEEHAEKTTYPTDTIRAEILLFRALLAEAEGKDSRELLSSYKTMLSESVSIDRYLLTLVLNAVREGKDASDTEALLIPVYKSAAQAFRAERDGDDQKIISLLTPIMDDPLIRNDPVLFQTFAKLLEGASASVGDFETAYRFAQKRLEHSEKERNLLS